MYLLSVNQDDGIEKITVEADHRDGGESSTVDLSEDLDLPVEELISNDLESNQDGPDSVPLPLIESPTVLIGKSGGPYDHLHFE